MNIVQVQDQLKNFSQDQLIREMQSPSGAAPQYLVLSEIMRRQKMQQDFANRQSQGAPQSTVAEDAIAAAGVPQGGIADMARALAPQTDMTQNTGVQTMYAGGPVKKMQRGGAAMTDPAIRAMANRMGMTVEEYLRSVGEEQATRIEEDAARRAMRDRMADMEPVGEGITMPTQTDLDRRFQEDQFAFGASRPLVAPAVENSAFVPPVMEGRILGRDTAAPGLAGIAAVADTKPRGGRTFTPEQRAVMEAAQPAVAPPMGGVLPPPKPPAGAIAPQYEEGTVFDPGTGVPISGGGVQGEVAGPTTGSFIQDLILSDEAKRQVADINAKVAATKGEAGRTDRDQQGTAAVPTPEEIEAAQPTAPLALTTPPGGTGGTGGISGAGAMSSYEQELMDMLGRREKAAEQDKWLALAQVGLNLMSSTQPTLGGALGEAGIKGVEAVRSARDQYDKDRLDLLGSLEQSRMARAAAAARAAGGARGNGKPINATMIGNIEEQLAGVTEQIARLRPPSEPSFWTGTIEDPDRAAREQLETRAAMLESVLSQAYATHGLPYLPTGIDPSTYANLSD